MLETIMTIIINEHDESVKTKVSRKGKIMAVRAKPTKILKVIMALLKIKYADQV